MTDEIPDGVILSDENGKVLSEKTLNRLRAAIDMANEVRVATTPKHATRPVELPGDLCSVDGRPIRMIQFKGSGVCCESCRQVRDGEVTREEADRIRKSHGDAR